LALTEDDRLWRDQNFPNMSDKELEKIIDTFSNTKTKDTNPKPTGTQVIEGASEFIMKQHTFITIEETGEIWYYDNGVYVPGGEIHNLEI